MKAEEQHSETEPCEPCLSGERKMAGEEPEGSRRGPTATRRAASFSEAEAEENDGGEALSRRAEAAQSEPAQVEAQGAERPRNEKIRVSFLVRGRQAQRLRDLMCELCTESPADAARHVFNLGLKALVKEEQ